jgi:hypothetical protein
MSNPASFRGVSGHGDPTRKLLILPPPPGRVKRRV